MTITIVKRSDNSRYHAPTSTDAAAYLHGKDLSKYLVAKFVFVEVIDATDFDALKVIFDDLESHRFVIGPMQVSESAFVDAMVAAYDDANEWAPSYAVEGSSVDVGSRSPGHWELNAPKFRKNMGVIFKVMTGRKAKDEEEGASDGE